MSEPNNTNLVLIDGNAIMHRAFHALPPLTNKQGQMTNAVYGFLSMLLTIIDKLQPTHLIVCFDRPEPTFRKSMYAGYQAHRPKMDDGLSGQFSLTKQALEAMDVPMYEKAGYEADDLLGTLSYQTCKNDKDARVTIVTGDRDILQLVTDRISVYMPVNGLNNGMLYTPEVFEKKFHIKPLQMVDYKALVGDSSDNYPGVRGIGPKTASTLLNDFGTIENLYDAIYHQDEKARTIKDKALQALSEYAEDAGMAKKLAKILTDAPVTLKIDDAKLESFDTPEALEVLRELGFSSIVRRIMGVEESSKIKTSTVKKEKKESSSAQASADKDSEQLSLV